MYGIVNKAIEDLVIANFGEEKWEAIKERSGVDIDFFISSEPYDDDVTFKCCCFRGNEHVCWRCINRFWRMVGNKNNF